MIRNGRFAIWICVAVIIACCDKGPNDPPDIRYKNPVFSSADYFIESGPPDSGDTTGATPGFAWEATGQDLVYLSVFDTNIQASSNRILNSERIVWSWHSGLGTGREGAVFFEDGRDVINGRMLENGPPTPLEAGASYVWAVWAWDDQGKRVTYSSREIKFTVE